MLLTEFESDAGVYEVIPFGPFQSWVKADEMCTAINRKIAKRFPREAADGTAPHAWVREMRKTRTEAYAELAKELRGQWENGRDPQNWNDVFTEVNE